MRIIKKKIMPDVFDVIIIGGGAAGLGAAMAAGRRGLRVILLEKVVFGGSVAVLESLSEYPGIEKTGGWELTQTMVKQAKNIGCFLYDGLEVTDVQVLGNSCFEVHCPDGERFHSRSVIVCSGGRPRMLNLENEANFSQRGVHSCAQCAGARYKEKKVVVAGNGSWAVRAAYHLIDQGCTVFFISGDAAIFGDAGQIKELLRSKRFQFLSGCHVTGLRGDKYLYEIEVADLAGGSRKKLEMAALFVYRTIIPNSMLVEAQKDAKGFFLVDEKLMTSIPGVFAAGRVVQADLPIQVMIGDGSRAALSAADWLQVVG